jgi:ABC-type Zn uptake system ZnuABC Zn-binding protein ZnuA
MIGLLLLLSACRGVQVGDDHAHSGAGGVLTLPAFQPVDLDGRSLKAVATTSIIGDVLANIGGREIELTVLIGRNKDTHSYEPTPQDFVALEEADVIFLNGWNLEEQLAEVVAANFAQKAVAISADITPRQLDNGSVDPHVWFAIDNVMQWAQNGRQILSQLDPENESTYTANLTTYLAQLTTTEQEVDALLAQLPVEKRKLVTNHAAFGYFADTYGFDVIGTIIPSLSSSAEPSASDLADLVGVMEREGVCTLFAETSQSDALARTVSAELSTCPNVQLLPLYTESTGDGDAASYIGMFRANVETIVNGLR